MKTRQKGHLGRRITARLGLITLEKVSQIGFANAQANAPRIRGGRTVVELQQTRLGEGDTALVIGAGPSLHRQDQAKLIKESGFRGVIVATESAMAWCLRHGIVPHLVVTVDPHHRRIVRWFGDPELSREILEQDDYFARQDMDPKFCEEQLMFNRELMELVNTHGSRMNIAVASSASTAVVNRAVESGMKLFWWNPMYDDYEKEGGLTRRICDMNGLPCVNAGGNVGSACWVFAHALLGKKRVALLGMDFGYYPDTPYVRTQYYNEILAMVGPERLDEVYIHIENPHLGVEFYTDPAYLWYRDSFLEMSRKAECETFNCTGGGILFGEGVQWMGLGEFLKRENK